MFYCNQTPFHLLPFIADCGFAIFQQESQLNKITRDSAKITVEQVHGLMSQVNCNLLYYHNSIAKKFGFELINTQFISLCQVIKDILFNSVGQPSQSQTDPNGPEAMAET